MSVILNSVGVGWLLSNGSLINPYGTAPAFLPSATMPCVGDTPILFIIAGAILLIAIALLVVALILRKRKG